MKKLIISLTLLLIVIVSCKKTSSDTFVLQGSFEGSELPDTVLLDYYMLQDSEWYRKTDTAEVVNGNFTFEGQREGIILGGLVFSIDAIEMYLEPCDMQIKVDLEQAYAYELSGTPAYKEIIELRREETPYEKTLYEGRSIVYNIIKQLNSTESQNVRDSLINLIHNHSEELTLNNKKKHQLYVDFASKHNTYQISPILLFRASRFDFVSSDTLLSVYNNFPEHLKNSLMGNLVYRQIMYQQGTGSATVGEVAPDFSRTDNLGNRIKLSDFKEKNYILMDFWASWCGPCIGGIPHLKETYNKYKDRQLQIISISSDENKEDWLKAVDRHNLGEWPQILDLTHSDGRLFDIEIADAYGVKELPTFILIDKDGKIIARWSGNEKEQLDKLENLLK